MAAVEGNGDGDVSGDCGGISFDPRVSCERASVAFGNGLDGLHQETCDKPWILSPRSIRLEEGGLSFSATITS